MTCPECGAHPHASAAFCTACGTDLLSPGRPAEDPRAQSPTPVQEMVGSERTAWIDSVWGSPAGAERCR